ncbi:MAG: DinB family protein [Gemmatimonadota bacterium]|jgi:uncharacterized damage-inducible protein DinB|nr:DinB family protein [Gemmatimonadota bacterium]
MVDASPSAASRAFVDSLERALLRDIGALRREIELFPDEAMIWQTMPGIGNSAGTLALHIAGNLQHYFGAVLGGTGYRRDRDAEFSRRDVPRAEVLDQLDRGAEAVRSTLARMEAAALQATYPEPVGGVTLPTERFLLHLATHLAFHLGQAGYLRRALTGSAITSKAVAIGELVP